MRKYITRISITFIASVLLIGLANDAHALKGFEVGARGYYWDTSLDASMASGGENIDLKDDLSMGDEAFGSGEAYLRWGRNHFTVAFTSISYDGDNTLSRDITFGGTTFSVTTRVISMLDYDQIDGIYQYDLIRYNPVIGTFNLGIALQLKYVDGFAEISNGLGPPEREEFSAPIPMIGLGGGMGLINNLVTFEARVAGMEYSGDRAFDGQALIGVIPYPFLKIFGGYKIFDLKVDENGFKIDYTIDGPFAGVQLSF